MIFFVFNNSLFAKLADFLRKSASFYLKIVCQLLPVKRYIKGIASLFLCLIQQVCHQLFPGGAFGCDLQFLVEENVLGGQFFHQVEDDLLVEAAAVGTVVQNTHGIDEHDLTGFHRHDRNGAGGNLGAGKGFAENLGNGHTGKNAAVAVVIYLNHLGRTGKHNSDFRHSGLPPPFAFSAIFDTKNQFIII